ncbi:ABC transporter substrate-binding protein [Actinomyces slackii]|uniref:Substrate binding domain of ABC-type glycine betaine transport system n=1 Tax=Actinomyces slackii TaxID=52774 RepID=A0A448KCI7_9ACTO|nr:ABC transporter substrate-binding protein [Actinomyces slackii]VEG74646.1 Substrate binding domain of ABC-type glycine betaine transport system [Actinomyces slackii]
MNAALASSGPRRPALSRRLLLASTVLAAGGLAACSNRDPFAQDRAGGAPGGTIVVGSQQYYSNEIIAELYARAMESAGLVVERQFQIGQREVYLPELESGAIQVIPEYGGNLLQYYDASATARNAETVYSALLSALPEALTALTPASATDQDSLTVTAATARAHSLTSIADLASLGRTVSIAANSEFATRPYGPQGLESVYGVKASVTPVEDSGGPLTVKALVDGTVDVADIYTSDPVIEDKGLVVLEDPRGLILPQQVTPLVSASLPAVAATAINRVSARLSLEELRALNARSTSEQLEAGAIAAQWLADQGL